MVQEEVPQVQVLVAEPGLAQVADECAHLLREVEVIRRPLSAQVEVVQVQVQLYRRLQRLEDDGVAEAIHDAEAGEVGHGPRRGDRSLLEPLEPLELAVRRAAAEPPAPRLPRERARRPRVKLQVIRPPAVLEPPDLAVAAVLHERGDARQVAQRVFKLVGRIGHGRVFICARGGVVEERVYDESVSVTNLTPDVLAVYVQNKSLNETARRQLDQIAQKKREIAANDAAIRQADADVTTLTQDQTRLRSNIESLNRVSGQQDQVQTYARQLAAAETKLAALRDTQSDLRKRKTALEGELSSLLERISF